MIRAAAKNDSGFFKELWRRVQSGVPSESAAEPVYSALISLKRCYHREKWDNRSGLLYKREIPSLVPVLQLPPGRRPPLTLAQIALALIRSPRNWSLPTRRSAGHAGRIVWIERPHCCCPGGTSENSPAFQRWVGCQRVASPEGTAEVQPHTK